MLSTKEGSYPEKIIAILIYKIQTRISPRCKIFYAQVYFVSIIKSVTYECCGRCKLKKSIKFS